MNKTKLMVYIAHKKWQIKKGNIHCPRPNATHALSLEMPLKISSDSEAEKISSNSEASSDRQRLEHSTVSNMAIKEVVTKRSDLIEAERLEIEKPKLHQF